MPAYIDYYVDRAGKGLVTGLNNASSVKFPDQFLNDTIFLRFKIFDRTAFYPGVPGAPSSNNIFSVLDLSNCSLKAALVLPTGGDSPTVYSTQYTWTKDDENQYFYALFPLNTSALRTLVGSSTSNTAYFELELTQDGYPETVFQQQITIKADGIKENGTVVPAGETALSLETATALFLKNENSGFILKNNTTGNRVFVWLRDDDTIGFDPIV